MEEGSAWLMVFTVDVLHTEQPAWEKNMLNWSIYCHFT